MGRTVLQKAITGGVTTGHVSDSKILNLLWDTQARNLQDPGFGTADPSGVASSQAAFDAAIADIPDLACGVVYVPAGKYLVTGIVIQDRMVTLVGESVVGQLYAAGGPGDQIRNASVIYSTTNAPIVKFTDSGGGVGPKSIASWGSGIQNLGILGSTVAGTGQTGVVVNNRQVHLDGVAIVACGGRGLGVYDCVAGSFRNMLVSRNVLEGVRINGSEGTLSQASVTLTIFERIDATQNGSHGFSVGWAFGVTFTCNDSESNQGFGWFFDQGADTNHSMIGCRGIGNWAENNAGKVGGVVIDPGKLDIRVNTNSVRENKIEWVHTSTLISYASGANIGNEWLYVYDEPSLTAWRQSGQLRVVRSGGGQNATDVDAIIIRDRLDSTDGRIRVSSVVSTFGVTMAVSDIVDQSASPRAIPGAVDAFTCPNNRGFTTRNAAGTANVQMLWTATDDIINVGDVTNGAGVKINGAKFAVRGTAPVVKPTVTGSRGGNAALASALTALASQGILLDSSTA